MKCLFEYFAHFYQVVFIIFVFFLYLRHKFFVRYMFCKYYLLVSGSTFHFFKAVYFEEQKILILLVQLVDFFHSYFVLIVLYVSFGLFILPNLKSQSFSLFFQKFVHLLVIFKSANDFRLNFECVIRSSIKFYFFFIQLLNYSYRIW